MNIFKKYGKSKYIVTAFTALFVLLFLYHNSGAQVLYNFGQAGGAVTSGTGINPVFFNRFPTVPTNISFFYGFSSNANGILKASSPGLSRLGDSTEAQACAGNGAVQFVKFGVNSYSPQGTLFSNMKFDVVFAGDSNALSNSSTGVWYFFIGDGNATSTQFMSNDTISKKLNEAGVSLRWTFQPDGTLSFARYDNVTLGWIDVTGFTWQQKKKYTIEIYANTNKNTTNSTVIFTRQGIPDTLIGKTMSIYVNNTHICQDVNISQYDNQSPNFKKMNSYCWYGEGSNNAWIFVDNAAAADNPPTSFAYYTKRPADGTTLDISDINNWTTSSNGTGGSVPSSFAVNNSTWFIRNYTGSSGVTFTLSQQDFNILGSSNSQIELGDSGQTAVFRIPMGKGCYGDIDIRRYGDLIIESTILPYIRMTETNSMVEYNNGDENMTYPLYYNLKIHSGTKTLTTDYIIDGTATIGNGTGFTDLIIPSGRAITGRLDANNNGKVTIRDSRHPLLGTLSAGSTVEYGGASQQNLQAGLAYHNLQINNSAGVKLSGNTLVNGTLSFISGFMIIDTNALTLNGTVSGASGASLTGSNKSRLYINGAGALGTLSFTPGGRILKHLSLDRTNSSGSVTLGSYLNITDTLTLKNGIINSSTIADSITLGSSIFSPGYLNFNQTGNYTSWINGKLQRFISQGAGNGSANSIVFPVGSITQWGGMKLIYSASNGTTNGGTISSFFTVGDPGKINTSPINDGGYIIDRYSAYAYWTLKNSGVSGIYEINLDAYNFSGLSEEEIKRQNLRVIKRQNNLNPWIVEGSHSPGSGDIFKWTVKRTGLSSFSDFTLGSWSGDNSLNGNSPLPVILHSFSSSLNGRNILLNWVTLSETNNEGFDVERSVFGSIPEFKKVGHIKGKGNPGVRASYTFEDAELNSGKYRYRLKQIDFNGNCEYYDLKSTVEISVPEKFGLNQNYPNPFNSSTKIEFSVPDDSRIKIVVYEITGKEIKVVTDEVRKAGYHSAMLDLSGMSSGIYFYKLTAVYPGGVYTCVKKMMLVK